MRQRLTLGAALLAPSQVVLLDEPGSGLDPEGQGWLRGIVRNLICRGSAVLLSSHLLDDVEACADRVLVLHQGKLLADEDLESYVSGTAQTVVARSSASAVLANALSSQKVTVERDGPDRLRIQGASVHEVAVAAVKAEAPLLELRPVRDTLRDAYLRSVAAVSLAAAEEAY